MKIKWSEDKTASLVSNLIVVTFAILLYLFFVNFNVVSEKLSAVEAIISPFVIGFVIAFLLVKPVNFFDRLQKNHISKLAGRNRIIRNISITISMVIFLLFVFILFYITLPELSASIMTLLNSLPDYLLQMEKVITSVSNYLHLSEDVVAQIYPTWATSISDFFSHMAGLIPAFLNYSWRFLSALLNICIGIIVAVYFLSSKEKFAAQIKKFMAGTLGNKKTSYVCHVGDISNKIFNGFVIGKLLDSLIIGIICGLCLFIMDMPYYLLISVVIGVTNIIPFFGPFIGAIPSALLIFLINPIQMVVFVIFIFILQQFDGNILSPFILGDATGLDAIWVIFAIIIGGGLFGFIGMFIGVPLCAVIYVMVKEWVESRLQQRGLVVETIEYYPKPPDDLQ